jgi:Fe-S cluster assembly protein SufD
MNMTATVTVSPPHPTGSPAPRFDEKAVSTVHQRSGVGGAFEKVRADALARVAGMPLPATHEEWWRYTRAEQFPWNTLGDSGKVSFDLREFGTGKPFANPGVRLTTGGEALGTILPRVEELLGRNTGPCSGDYVDLIQRALCSGVAVIEVAPGVQIDPTILISQTIPAGATAASPLIVLFAGAGARCSFIEELPTLAGGLLLSRVEIVAAENAKVNFTSIQNLPTTTSYFGRHRLMAETNSVVELVHAAVGSKVARLDLEVNLNGPGAQVNMLSATLADGRRHLDFHPSQVHRAPRCGSNLYAKAVVMQQARSVYAGFIKVHEGAQQTDAYQKNRNLLLSSEARADSIPNLEIKANDVKCSHGASVGQIGEEEMFYLLSRGLTRVQAEKLLVEAFFEDLFSKIKDQAIHAQLSEIFLKQLKHGA